MPIGRPIVNLKTHILDDGLLPAAQGVAAELYLGGIGLARGYHNRAALTAERFVPDPFDEQGGRLYRTGDLARYRDKGVIEYAGRIDHQVKIRGLRIELGEIEARLHEHAGVREANVIDIDGPSGKQLVAYLVRTDAGLDSDALRETLKTHLKAHVPDYMVPTYFVFIEVMPLTANGKLDRRALPKPDVARSQQGHVAPRTEFEQRLAALWEQVLQVERVGLNDNFFALGGHSLLAVSLAGRIRETFDVSIKLHDFLLMQTLGELADFMRTNEAKVKSAVIVMNANRSDNAPLFCLPPGGGGTYSYYPLAGQLSDSRPVYGLVNKAYVVPGWFDTSWQEMVDYYVEQIRMTQPHGPYNLLGWSMGGALAIEVAHVLEREGDTVSFLGLVDTQLPASVGMEWVEEAPEVTTQKQGENYYRSLIKSLQAFVPGLQEASIVGLIETARQSLSSEGEVIDWVVDHVALEAGMNADNLRSIFQDIAVQDEIETGYKLLEANAQLSQAFTLKTLNVQADCWWAGQSRAPGQIARAEAVLLEQCSVNGLRSSTTVDQRHDNVVLAEVFLQGLAERLCRRRASRPAERHERHATASSRGRGHATASSRGRARTHSHAACGTIIFISCDAPHWVRVACRSYNLVYRASLRSMPFWTLHRARRSASNALLDALRPVLIVRCERGLLKIAAQRQDVVARVAVVVAAVDVAGCLVVFAIQQVVAVEGHRPVFVDLP